LRNRLRCLKCGNPKISVVFGTPNDPAAKPMAAE
jgi:hypothetical protein